MVTLIIKQPRQTYYFLNSLTLKLFFIDLDNNNHMIILERNIPCKFYLLTVQKDWMRSNFWRSLWRDFSIFPLLQLYGMLSVASTHLFQSFPFSLQTTHDLLLVFKAFEFRNNNNRNSFGLAKSMLVFRHFILL